MLWAARERHVEQASAFCQWLVTYAPQFLAGLSTSWAGRAPFCACSPSWCLPARLPARVSGLQHYDPSSGYVAGTMEAANVPDALEPVCTFFEGEIIDNVNHTFYTADWDACAGEAPLAPLHTNPCLPACLPACSVGQL